MEKSGSWFSFSGERLGQGRENSKTFLKENEDIRAQIEEKVKVAMGIIKPRLKEVEASNQ